jgi:platelet-activating factor acetylhydrolase IB subunit alpha
VSASRDASLRIWDISTGYCLKTIGGHNDWVRDVSPSFDGQWLSSGGNDQAAMICDVLSGETKATLIGHENFVEYCSFAPPSSYRYLAALAGKKKPPPVSSSAEYVATGTRDKVIRIYGVQGSLIKSLIGQLGERPGVTPRRQIPYQCQQ